MKYPLVGRTGVRVSSLAFGTMTFGGQANLEQSHALYKRCREAGITHFDTADVYNEGRSEELLGSFIKHERDQVFIASKCYFATGPGPNARGTSRYHLLRACDASLARLETDRIDLYYLHRFDDEADLEETLRGVELLVQSGKVLYPAVSNFAAWQVAKALGVQALHHWAPLVAMQPMYSLAKRQAEVELLPMARAEKLAVFSYGPLGGGLLSGKYGLDDRPRDGRLSAWPAYTKRYADASNYELAERFRTLAREAGVHPVTLAVAWVQSNPAITAPLLGAHTLEQLEPALAAAEYTLSSDLHAAITALTIDPPPATDRVEERTMGSQSVVRR